MGGQERNGDLEQTFDRSVEEGTTRLHRPLVPLLATAAAGAVDLGVGVIALLVVQHATGSKMLAALAFGVGFIALTLVKSELFTENFLVPIAAVVAKRASLASVLRLWAGTLVGNLLGGWLMMALVMAGLPELRSTAVEVGRHYPELGIGWSSLAAAVLGGTVITLMTWMERSTESMPAKLVAAVAGAFVLAAGPLNHVIVSSLEMFGALQAGAPFGYADWAVATAWAVLGNLLGGLGLVTVLRILQVGPDKLREERASGRDHGREQGRRDGLAQAFR